MLGLGLGLPPSRKAGTSNPVAAAAVATFQSKASSTFDLSSYNFNGNTCVTAAGDRIVVTVEARGAAPSSPSCTIKGSSATLVVSQTMGNTNSVMIFEVVDSVGGSTADVTVNLGAAQARAAIQVYKVTGAGGASSIFGSDTSSSPTFALNVPVDGCVIGCGIVTNNTSWTLTNLPEDVDDPLESVVTVTSGHNNSASGSTTLTFTPLAVNQTVACAAAWGP